jgi:hypothetical protein
MRRDAVEGSGPGRWEDGSSVSTPVNRGPRIVRLKRMLINEQSSWAAQ